ncbi:VWA domain-containing protein [Paenibacillus sp. NEAU-GSW1]|uniref:vWA domain-containing protein n=1 Tax=Paenibacillus sp. NEAU-GSW1 TaxID=2682486 RepID=UPI0012E22D65|nr:VWA domain-containing protein [Paenibacillus sp. NEAU-GSW1]MUT66454.1 VWA domain-containing protein [Paenibacillus sp. NEAU-GSW1]
MQFLSPISAFFALSLPAIVILYLLKRTYIDTEISSHMLWNRVLQEQEANRPWQKLRRRPLLLLQLLAAALLVLAIMGPYWKQSNAPQGHAVLIVDRSASMTAKGDDEQPLMDQMKAQAASWISEQPSNRLLTIIATGEQPELIASRELDHNAAIEAISSLHPTFGAADNLAAMSLADSLLTQESDGEIVLFTDGRWKDAAEVNELQLHSSLRLMLASDSVDGGNAAIVHFGLKDQPNSDNTREAVLTVRNDSNAARQMTIKVYAEGSKSAIATEKMKAEANGWASVKISKLPGGAAFYKAVLEYEGDRYEADNMMYQFPAAAGDKTALLVSDGNLFLEKALLLAGVSTLKVNAEQYVPSAENGKELDWIIIDGDAERLLKDKNWTKLLREKPVWYIDHPDETGAVPANSRIEIAAHPITSYLSLADTHIGRLDEPAVAWGEPIVKYGGIPAIFAGTVEGKPQLRFTFDLQDTDLPLRPEFPVLIVQAADWMSGGIRSELGSSIADANVEVSVGSDTAKAEWMPVELLKGYGQSNANSPIVAADLTSGVINAPAIPGLYRLKEYDGSGRAAGDRMLAVMADPGENEAFGQATEPIAPVSAAKAPDTNTDNTEQMDRAGIGFGMPAAAASAAGWLALLLFALLIGEWEVYRRGNAG